MTLATLQGAPVIDMRLCLPLTGRWTADVSVDTEEDLSGFSKLIVNDTELTGVSFRGGVGGDVGAWIIGGGNGGMSKMTLPRHYQNTTVGLVVNEILKRATEFVSASVEPALLSQPLANWTVLESPAATALESLLRYLGDYHWRFDADGDVWIGEETWPVVVSSAEIQSENLRLRKTTIRATEREPLVLPGTVFGFGQVSYAEYTLDNVNAAVTGELWIEDDRA